MKSILVLFVAVLFLAACRDKNLVQLEFLEVRTEAPLTLNIGQILLVGRIAGLSESSAERCGFVWSNDPDSVSAFEEHLRRLEVGIPPVGNDSFSVVFRIKPQETVYVRAFAQLGDRLVYAREILSASLDRVVEMAGPSLVENNSAGVFGRLVGLKALNQTLSRYGHVYSSSDAHPEIGKPGCDTTLFLDANDDGVFTSHLKNLAFNTTYFVRAYAVDDQQEPVYSDQTDTFRVRDGWERIGDFPVIFQDGAAVATSNGFAYAGFGTFNVNLSPPDIPKEFWQFSPGNFPGWMKTASNPFNNDPVYKRTNTSVFSIGDTIYVIFGEQHNPNTNALRSFWKYSIGSDSWQNVSIPISQNIFNARSGAAGFVLNGKIYVGSGVLYTSTAYIYKNDFWEYNPETGNWRQVKSLPLKTSNAPVAALGRSDALGFASASFGYVGCGEYLGLTLNDFWKFTPPESVQDSGKWELVENQFPGLARINAVSFVIGNKAYVGTGWNLAERNLNDFYAFDFATETWSKKTAFQGGKRQQMMAFALDGYGYAGTGIERIIDPNGQTFHDEAQSSFWRYTPEN